MKGRKPYKTSTAAGDPPVLDLFEYAGDAKARAREAELEILRKAGIRP